MARIIDFAQERDKRRPAKTIGSNAIAAATCPRCGATHVLSLEYSRAPDGCPVCAHPIAFAASGRS